MHGTSDSCWNKTRSYQDDELVCNKKLRKIVFGNLNKTITNAFLEIGKSSYNVLNVFKGYR